jgi:hypothetical protein
MSAALTFDELVVPPLEEQADKRSATATTPAPTASADFRFIDLFLFSWCRRSIAIGEWVVRVNRQVVPRTRREGCNAAGTEDSRNGPWRCA